MQLDFDINFPGFADSRFWPADGNLTFFPFNFHGSVSLSVLNLLMHFSNAGDATYNIKVGLYSLNSSTLSLANYISGTTTIDSADQQRYISLTATSSAQNITPGTWFWGIKMNRTGNSASQVSFYAQPPNISFYNSFPVGFIGGLRTATSADIPSSIATSDIDTNAFYAMVVPVMIISA